MKRSELNKAMKLYNNVGRVQWTHTPEGKGGFEVHASPFAVEGMVRDLGVEAANVGYDRWVITHKDVH